VIAPTSASLRAARIRCIFAAAAVLAATIIVVGAMTSGYRPWADAVSRLASRDEPHRLVARAGLVLYGALVLIGAGPLAERDPAHQRLLAWLIGGFGVAGVVAGLAPKDPPRAPHTLISHVHVASTIVGGAMLLGAMAVVARFAPSRCDRRTAAGIGGVTTLGVVIFPFTWGSRIYGVLEISLLALATAWLVILAMRSRSGSHASDGGVIGPIS
jgi:hypothetical protein